MEMAKLQEEVAAKAKDAPRALRREEMRFASATGVRRRLAAGALAPWCLAPGGWG
jgi:hypothetical protein